MRAGMKESRNEQRAAEKLGQQQLIKKVPAREGTKNSKRLNGLK